MKAIAVPLIFIFTNSKCHLSNEHEGNRDLGLSSRQIGFYGIFSISASLYVVAIIYGLFYVDEPDIKINEKQKLKSAEKSLLADFFDLEHVRQTYKVAFKKGENQRRLRVSMLLIVVMVVIGPMHGKANLKMNRTLV